MTPCERTTARPTRRMPLVSRGPNGRSLDGWGAGRCNMRVLTSRPVPLASVGLSHRRRRENAYQYHPALGSSTHAHLPATAPPTSPLAAFLPLLAWQPRPFAPCPQFRGVRTTAATRRLGKNKALPAPHALTLGFQKSLRRLAPGREWPVLIFAADNANPKLPNTACKTSRATYRPSFQRASRVVAAAWFGVGMTMTRDGGPFLHCCTFPHVPWSGD